MSTVDIIVPLYNKQGTVARTIESILSQTHTDWRLIVVDDGSTDEGAKVVQSFDDSRINLLRQDNRGPGAARNTGINAATADLIAFLDADDQWYPWYLENAVRAIENNAVSLVGSYYYEWPQQMDMTRHWQRRGVRPGVHLITNRMPPKQIEAMVLFFHVGTTLVRCETAIRYGGFYEDHCLSGEDTIFFARLVLNEPFMVIGPAAVRHNRQDSGLSVAHDVPLSPALTDPDVILAYCSEDKKQAARLFLMRLALRTAHHKARNGLKEQAVYLLEKYPDTRRFVLEYLRCKAETKLSRWMPYWVKFKCTVGPSTRRFLKTAAVRLGLAKAPPEP
ncbi:MAG TPA: glycosyltransferase family 2 protein [Phycisphaerales bacterium]|nr:glycosyltransferase family 2 protein [Phycisphaerales bacterium]